jgi:ribosome-associated heat shock protein Hsp15
MREASNPNPAPSLRIDKWLWAARFFKTRGLASHACDLGRIQANGLRAKPAREIHAGDRVRIQNESGVFEIDVLGVSAMRGPAAQAQTLYRETDASREARARLAEQRKAFEQFTPLPDRRPSKRDRRRIIQFRGQFRGRV